MHYFTETLTNRREILEWHQTGCATETHPILQFISQGLEAQCLGFQSSSVCLHLNRLSCPLSNTMWAKWCINHVSWGTCRPSCVTMATGEQGGYLVAFKENCSHVCAEAQGRQTCSRQRQITHPQIRQKHLIRGSSLISLQHNATFLTNECVALCKWNWVYSNQSLHASVT